MNEIKIGSHTITETERQGIVEYAWDSMHIYRIPVECYPGHNTNTYLILDDPITLIDTGLDGKKARADLNQGIEIVNSEFGQKVGFEDISGIYITHGHADHWGMLSHPDLKGKTVYINELDSEVLVDFKTRFANAKARIQAFTAEAGWELETGNFFSLDKINIDISEYDLIEVRDNQKIINGYEVIHVPGHSAGQSLLKLGPVIFLGDHILSETTPHQLPGSMVAGCGLRLYLDSLHKAAGLGNLLGLPAHEDTIYSIKDRVDELDVFHYKRLDDILSLCGEEKNLFQVTDEYYRLRPEYINGRTVADLVKDEQILALEEIKAHLEYLIEEDKLKVSRIDDGVIRYVRT